jgi:hypothetical protein
VYVSENGTFTMQGGEISGNSVFSQAISVNSSSYGGGVYVSESGTFTKQPGAVIYGADAGSTLKNTVQAEQGTGDGHAVYISGTKRRNSTAGTEVTLDSSIDGTAGGWEEPLQ